MTTFTYDDLHRLSTRSTPSGLLSTHSYGTNGYLSATVDSVSGAAIRTNAYTWLSARLRTHTDERGLARTYTWDALGRLTQVDYPDSTSRQYSYVRADGTNLLDLTAAKDRLGNWTYYTYNSLRQALTVTDPLSRVTAYGYCGCGSVEDVLKAWGTALVETNHYVYDQAGRRTHTYFPDGSSVTNVYSLLGQVTVVGDGWGWVTNTYNHQGLLVAVSNYWGRAQRMVYDVHDRLLESTDANGVTVTNTYDAAGRLRTRAYPDGGVEAFGYTSGVGGPTSYTNQLGNVTAYTYHAAGWRTNEVSVGVMTNRFTYNGAGDLLSLADGLGRVTTWTYNAEGQVRDKYDPRGTNILDYLYDANGRLTNRWSKAKGNTRYRYDAVGLPREIVHHNRGSVQLKETRCASREWDRSKPVSHGEILTNVDYPSSTDLRFQYDALNRLTNMVDASGTSTYSYYLGGQLASETGPWASSMVSYGYSSRLRVALTNQQPTGSWTSSCTYDPARRLTGISGPSGSFGYLYVNAANSVGAGTLAGRLLLPNSAYLTNTYDTNLGRLLWTKLNSSNHVTLNAHGYLYNLAGQRYQVTRTDSSYFTNAYDAIGELIKSYGTGNQSPENLGYGYDPAWNMTLRTNSGTVTTYTVNNLNQVTGEGANTYNYDYNGNRLTKAWASGSLNYGYDDENQLVSIATDTYYTPAGSRWKTEFTYDGRGRMRLKKDYVWNPYTSAWALSAETRYVYDGMRVIHERDGNNVPTLQYTRGLDLSGTLEGAGGIGGLLARSHGYSNGSWSTHNYYAADGNGNVTYLLTTNQTCAAEYRYDPFGRTLYANESLPTPNLYRFSSKMLHANSGLYYYGYRFYDPNVQRWISRDPLGEMGFGTLNHVGPGVARESNPYLFVRNTPNNNVDILGLRFFPPIEILFPPNIGGSAFGPCWLGSVADIPADSPVHAGDKACIWRCREYGPTDEFRQLITMVTWKKPCERCPVPEAPPGKTHLGIGRPTDAPTPPNRYE